ncbi:hypothetical protein D3C75_698300 [compost metagenome]
MSAADHGIHPAVIAAVGSGGYIADARNIDAGRIGKRQPVLGRHFLQRFERVCCISISLAQCALRPFND